MAIIAQHFYESFVSTKMFYVKMKRYLLQKHIVLDTDKIVWIVWNCCYYLFIYYLRSNTTLYLHKINEQFATHFLIFRLFLKWNCNYYIAPGNISDTLAFHNFPYYWSHSVQFYGCLCEQEKIFDAIGAVLRTNHNCHYWDVNSFISNLCAFGKIFCWKINVTNRF